MWIRLVVLKLDVVARLVLLDESRFQNQRFNFTVGDDEFEIGYLTNQGVGLAIKRAGGTKVGTHPTTKVFCLTDIDYLPGRVFM